MMTLKHPIDVIIQHTFGDMNYNVHVTVRRIDRQGIDYIIYAIYRNGEKLHDRRYQELKDYMKEHFAENRAEFRQAIENNIKKYHS